MDRAFLMSVYPLSVLLRATAIGAMWDLPFVFVSLFSFQI